MNIEEKLQDYIKAKYGSIYAFTKEIGMANSTFATLMKRGIHSASITSLIKICKALDISGMNLHRTESLQMTIPALRARYKTSNQHWNISTNTDMTMI